MAIGAQPIGAAPIGAGVSAAQAPGAALAGDAQALASAAATLGDAPLVAQLALDIEALFATVTPALTLDIGTVAPFVPTLVLDIAALPSPPVARAWRVVVTLGGVDISARITGEVMVRMAESEASVATFTYRPPAGPVNLPLLVGAAVTVELAELVAGSVLRPMRRFSGVVDVPAYDVRRALLSCTCTDQLQERIDGADRGWVDAEVGGYFSTAVSGEPRDTYQYATARLASVPRALDADVYGALRVTDWAARAVPDVTLTEADILDGTLAVHSPYRSDVRNRIEVSFDYQYPRLRGRGVSAAYSIGSQVYIYDRGLDYLSKAMVEGALQGLGSWTLRDKILYEKVPGGTYNLGSDLFPKWVAIPPEDAPNLTTGFSARLWTRWTQSATERYTLTVRNADSVAAIGPAREQRSVSLAAQFDSAAWEAGESAAPAISIPAYGDAVVEYGEAGVSDRAAADNALRTAVAQAQTTIQGSHRTARVSATVYVRALLDCAATVYINTARVQARGKVVAVTDRYDTGRGSARQEVVIALSGHNAVGVQPYSPPDPPAAPADPTPAPETAAYHCTAGTFIGQMLSSPPYDAETMVGFSTNAKLSPYYDPAAENSYPLAFSLSAPEVEAAARDPLVMTQAATYETDIPQDLFEVTQ